jgi:Na+/proline symporter
MSTSRKDRRLIARGAVMAVAAASLLLLSGPPARPPWLHWIGSLVALAAALGAVVVAELTWQRALSTATAAGLVARPTHT